MKQIACGLFAAVAVAASAGTYDIRAFGANDAVLVAATLE